MLHDRMLAKLVAADKQVSARAAAESFDGSWTNQLGSTADFVVNGMSVSEPIPAQSAAPAAQFRAPLSA